MSCHQQLSLKFYFPDETHLGPSVVIREGALYLRRHLFSPTIHMHIDDTPSISRIAILVYSHFYLTRRVGSACHVMPADVTDIYSFLGNKSFSMLL
jgi:hypothetical protein